MTTLLGGIPNNDGKNEVLNRENLGNLFSKPCLHLLCGGQVDVSTNLGSLLRNVYFLVLHFVVIDANNMSTIAKETNFAGQLRLAMPMIGSISRLPSE
jgi:tRNA G18 (ribose-2'-O)-methylase SpoU